MQMVEGCCSTTAQTSVFGRCRVAGGEPIERGPETVRVDWFFPEELPGALAPAIVETIQDTLSVGPEPISKEVRYPLW